MKRLLVLPLLALAACGPAPQKVAQSSKDFCFDLIGYDDAPGTAERIAGLDCTHAESIYRRGAAQTSSNMLLGATLAAGVASMPQTSTVIHKIR